MSPAYQKGVKKNCPDAEVVFDRFHVMQRVGKAVDEVRRREHQRLSRKGDKSLKKSMWLFRNNPKNLNAEQTAHLDELKRANLITAKAYQMRLNLQEIYNLNSLECFKRKLNEWCAWVQSYGKSKGYLFNSTLLNF